MSHSHWTIWGTGKDYRNGHFIDLLDDRSLRSGIGLDSLPDARKRARVIVHARLHAAAMRGVALEAAVNLPVQMDRAVHKSRNGSKTLRETWGAKLLPGGQWEVVRTWPEPMPVPIKRPKAPRHKADKPSLIPVGDLRAAWDLMWLLEPAQAVALIESGSRFLKDPEATSLWFHEGMGGSSLGFLLDLFWPDRKKPVRDADGFSIEAPGQRPQATGYKIEPGSKEACLKRLLKALGRNDWQRAESMQGESSVNTYYWCFNKVTGKQFKKRGRIKNGRFVRVRGVSHEHSAHNPSEFHDILTYGFRPRDAASVLTLLELRLLITRRLQEARPARHKRAADFFRVHGERRAS